MAVIKDKDKKKLEALLKELPHEVKIIMFTQEMECQYCELTRNMLQEVKELSPKISLEIKDLVKDADLAKQYGIDKIPATIIMGERDYGIRFFGVPAGYEFTSLIEDIVMVSHRDPLIPKEVMEELDKVDQPVHVQVFINPT